VNYSDPLDPAYVPPRRGGCLGALLSLSAGGFAYTAAVFGGPLVTAVATAGVGLAVLEHLRRHLERRSTPLDPAVVRLAHLGGGRRP